MSDRVFAVEPEQLPAFVVYDEAATLSVEAWDHLAKPLGRGRVVSTVRFYESRWP